MRSYILCLLLTLSLAGCSNPAVEYGTAVSAIRKMSFTKSFLTLFGDDCLVTAIYYDGKHGQPGVAMQVIHDRRYKVAAYCDVKYSSDYLNAEQVSPWNVTVTEIVKLQMTSRENPTIFFGRSWDYTENEWEKVMSSNEGFSSLRLPPIPEASGDGIDSVEKQYGKSHHLPAPQNPED